MLTAIVLLQNLKWMVPTTLMLGVAPAYFTTWTVWRLLSAPFPSWVYVKGDDILFSTYHRQLLFYFELISGIEVIFYGDLDAIEKVKGGENCVYMSNHQSTVDWVLASSVSMRRGSLGRTRYILKDGLRYLPWYGFYLGMHGSIFVKRAKKFNKDKAHDELGKSGKKQKPMWLVVFPEGTRYNPEITKVITDSQEFTKTQGLAPLDSVLFPRIRAMQASLKQLRGSVDSVYDVTLAYGNTFDFASKKRCAAPTMQDVLLGVPKKVHVHVKRIPVEEVPYDDTGLKDWLYQRFQEKDRLLAEFYQSESEENARFPGPSKTQPLTLLSVLPSVVLWGGSFIAIHAFKTSRDFYGKLAIGTMSAGIVFMAIRK